MLTTVDELFATYCSLPKRQERIAQAFATPRLLYLPTVKALMPKVTQSDKEDSEYARLFELDQLRLYLAGSPGKYRIGAGPIEQLMARGIAPAEMIARCRSAELQALISPLYLRLVAYHAEDRVRADGSEAHVWLSRYLAEAAVAWAPDGAIEHDISEVVNSHLQMAFFSLLHELDESVLSQSVALGVGMVERAEKLQDNENCGKFCQTIGAIFSDIWTAGGRPDDTTFRFEEWAKRSPRVPGLFVELGNPGTLPEIGESLRIGVDWFQRALRHRVGVHRGLTYKAIAQTLHFLDVALKQPVSVALCDECVLRARELLRKQQDAAVHMQVLDSIAARRGLNLEAELSPLSPPAQALIDKVRATFEPGDPAAESAERRLQGHSEAVRDLERALRHVLPFALYLRNFAGANGRHMLGDIITIKSEEKLTIVVPEISYSLVDHKILQLFEEGVVAVCDPALSDAHRLTLIPMLSLRNEEWLETVKELIRRCTRIVMLLDDLTPGVLAELDLLAALGAAERTLIVTGQEFRRAGTAVPPQVARRFPHIVDWIDFAYDESYHSNQYKAHGVVQQHLLRYVRSNAKPAMRAWLGNSTHVS